MELTPKENELKALLSSELMHLLMQAEQMGVSRAATLALMSAVALGTFASEHGADKAHRIAATLATSLQNMAMLEPAPVSSGHMH